MRSINFYTTLQVIGLFAAVSSTVIETPACGSVCIDQGLAATTCPENNYDCLCSEALFISTVASCLARSCSPDDQVASEQGAAATCEQYTGTSNLVALQDAVSSAQDGNSPMTTTPSASLTPQATVSTTSSVPVSSTEDTTTTTSSATSTTSSTSGAASATSSTGATNFKASNSHADSRVPQWSGIVGLALCTFLSIL